MTESQVVNAWQKANAIHLILRSGVRAFRFFFDCSDSGGSGDEKTSVMQDGRCVILCLAKLREFVKSSLPRPITDIRPNNTVK